MTAQDNLETQASLKRETLLSWRSLSRPFKKASKEAYATLIVIALLLSVILFFFSQYALILVVWAVVFLGLVLVTVPPHDIDHKITSQGIVIGEHAYLWEELYDFYFKKHFGEDILIVRGRTVLPFLLSLTLGPVLKEQAKETLVKYLPFREVVELSFTDKAGDWLVRTFPLEKN